jgi:hypothetical protein
MAILSYGQVGWRSAAPASGQDADALAFITAAAITDTTQKTAINTLVTQLKSYGIWTKMKALYPFVGGTAAQHRFNLKSPGTTNADFYLAFNGGGLHSVTGYKPNGTTTYVDTFFNPSVNLSNATSNNHMSLYIRENIDEAKVDMGCFTTTPFGVAFDIESRFSGNAYYQNFRASNYITFASTDSRGLHINTRTSSNLQKVFINSTLKATDTVTTTNNINANISIAARYNNQNNAYEYRSSKEIAFSSIGDGLTDADAANFYTAVQAYQTTLGRQV